MRAITITQPWASLIAIGAKHIETRTWAPHSLHMGERIAIHAGKGLGEMERWQFYRLCAQEPFRTALVQGYHAGLLPGRTPDQFDCGDLPRGAIVAIVEFDTAYRTTDPRVAQHLTDQERAFGNYSPGRWAWHFTAIQPVTPPIPARGAQGIWLWDEQAPHVVAPTPTPTMAPIGLWQETGESTT